MEFVSKMAKPQAQSGHEHLTEQQYSTLILRKTEAPGSYVDSAKSFSGDVMYKCPNCSNLLFSSAAKFVSGEYLQIGKAWEYSIESPRHGVAVLL